jgi:predicted dienelactone hydrolase
MIGQRFISCALFAAALVGTAFAAPASQTTKYVEGQPAIQQWFPTVLEEADGLPGHTVYRPADMTRFAPNSVPVIVWANGACRTSNFGFIVLLTTLANHGFVVIAMVTLMHQLT